MVDWLLGTGSGFGWNGGRVGGGDQLVGCLVG